MNEAAQQKSLPLAGDEVRNPLSPRRRAWVVAGLILGIFLAAIEQTVVATAMPTLVATLGGLNIYSWVFSAYLLAATVSVPLWGRFADMYGRKQYYLGSTGLFLLGSVLAGQARSMEFLVAARAIQGLGAGGVFPIGSTILSDIFSLERRARLQGLFSSVWGFASMVGPLVGGLITDYLSWRWVFYVNVPFGLAAIVIVERALTEPATERPKHSLDLRGILALSASVTLLLLAMIELGEGERGALVWSLLAGSSILLGFFILSERWAKEPLLPVALFRNGVFRLGSAVGFFSGMGLFGAISFVPLFVQGVLFGTATRAGSALTPLMLAWVSLSAASGWMILLVGYRPLIIAGMTFFIAGFVLLTRLGAESGYPAIWLAMGVLGVGMGLTMVTLLLGVQNSVPRKLIATATSTMVFFRTIGGTIGVALMGAVLTHHLTVASASTDNADLVALASRPDAIVQASTRAGLSAEAAEWLRHALAEGLDGVFLTGLIIGIVSFGVALFFPRGSARELAARREGPL